MSQEYVFDGEQELLDALRTMVKDGVPAEKIRVVTPFPVDEVDEILRAPRSRVRYFTLAGALSGLIAGFAFTIYTVLS